MNELKLVSHNGQALADSRDVAAMIEKRHDNLVRDISGYVAILETSKLRAQDFFIQSTYVTQQNKTAKYFLLTKIGCDMVANKMTGTKGVLFTAAYTKKFEQMEKELAEQNKPSYMIDDPVKRAERWIEERKAVEADLEKAKYAKHVLESDGSVNISQIAEDYGMSGTEMNKLLHKLGIQYKSGKQWLLYSKHKGKAYTDSMTMPIVHRDGRESYTIHTKWTQQGRMFIYETLKANGILPVMEQRKLYLVERKGEKV